MSKNEMSNTLEKRMALMERISKEKDLNVRIMQELGLEVNSEGLVVDQDTGDIIAFKGKQIVGPGVLSHKDRIPFDPVNNTKMMNTLFSYYTQKVEEEDGVNPAAVFYPVDVDSKVGTKVIVAKDEHQDEHRSRPYMNDALCYADLIFQINGTGSVDLSGYDTTREERELRRQAFGQSPKKNNNAPKKGKGKK